MEFLEMVGGKKNKRRIFSPPREVDKDKWIDDWNVPLRHLVSITKSPGISEILKIEIQETIQNSTAHDKWEVSKMESLEIMIFKERFIGLNFWRYLKSLVLYYLVRSPSEQKAFSFFLKKHQPSHISWTKVYLIICPALNLKI